MKKVIVLAVALTLVLSVAALAGGNPEGKIAVHIKAHPTSCTKGYPTFTYCPGLGVVYTYAGGGDIDVLPVFYDLAQYTVVETGLIWPEAAWGTGSWVRCKGDVSVGGIFDSADWVAQPDLSKRGVAVAWSVCQIGMTVAPGYVWLNASSSGRICPAHNPAVDAFGFVDCAATYDFPFGTSCAGVAGAIGDDPCRYPPDAVEQSTWGQIKSVFK